MVQHKDRCIGNTAMNMDLVIGRVSPDATALIIVPWPLGWCHRFQIEPDHVLSSWYRIFFSFQDCGTI